MSDVPLSKLRASVSSWTERQESAPPFTAEQRKLLAMQVANARIWRRPEDQDDTEEPELAALKTRAAGLLPEYETIEALAGAAPGAGLAGLLARFESQAKLDGTYFFCNQVGWGGAMWY